MRAVIRTILPALVLVATLVPAVPAGADHHSGLPSSDYDLSTLELKQAVYDGGNDEIVTETPFNSKVLLPPMAAALPSGRYLEVEVSPGADVDVVATWYDPAFEKSNLERVHASMGDNQVVLLDLSAMGTTDGNIRVRLYNTTAAATVHRITLFEAVTAAEDPNIVVILVDDMRWDEMEMGFYQNIPGVESALENELLEKGVTFRNFFNSTPLCCPSRASYLTGQYPHNHNVWTNNGTELPSDNGGILRFWLDDRDLTSLGTWMQEAGYTTSLIGKYLNGYPNRQGLAAMGVGEDYVPRGWDDWHGTFLSDKTSYAPLTFSYFGFRMNDNGSVNTYDTANTYLTDVEADKAVEFIEANAGGPDPFFLYLNPYAPHGPTTPAPRHLGMHHAAAVRPTPFPDVACNEGDPGASTDPDDSDKPLHIQVTTNWYGTCWSGGWQKKLDMTLALDEMIEDIFATLDAEGITDDTYVIFTSDNGQLRGEHGIGGKSAPYEESIRTPLIIRGPGIPEGLQRPHLSGNIDIAPTVLDMAGGAITPGSPPVDGESLLDPATGAVSSEDWRDGYLIELLTTGASPKQEVVIPPYSGVRTADHIYIKYDTTEREFYDLVADPYQLHSDWDGAPLDLRNDHKTLLQQLDNCAGAGCATAARLPGGPGNEAPTAAFTISCTDLTCDFDGSGSSDTDGTITDWSWDFGDTTGASGETTSHTYAAAGDFTVMLTVTDDGGAEDTETDTASPTAAGTMHISAMEILFKPDKDNAIAKVTVVDGSDTPVETATVTGTWYVETVAQGSFGADTAANGKAKIVFTDPDAVVGETYEFCVDDIVHGSLTYDSGADLVVPACVDGTWPPP